MGKANGRKSIFITGAASGMGYQTAHLFAKEGWFIGGYDVNEEGLKKLAGELGADNCIVKKLDVTNRAEYQKTMAEFAAETDGKMDILFNNAGIGGGGLFADLPFETVMAVVNTNFVGVLIGIHEGIKYLRNTPGSMCFTTSSSSATYGMAGIATYSATKHAVKGLTEALAVEFKMLGVKCVDVLPGLIDTPIVGPDAAKNAPKEGIFRAIPPVEIAKVVWQAYTSDKLHWYVPPEIFEMDKAATLEPERTRDRFLDGTLRTYLDEQSEKAGIYPKK
jgi:NAD(P)-dependent dehydrogenase (short-subunit alcohol dehydrogenase family)